MRTRITLNTDTFYVLLVMIKSSLNNCGSVRVVRKRTFEEQATNIQYSPDITGRLKRKLLGSKTSLYETFSLKFSGKSFICRLFCFFFILHRRMRTSIIIQHNYDSVFLHGNLVLSWQWTLFLPKILLRKFYVFIFICSSILKVRF